MDAVMGDAHRSSDGARTAPDESTRTFWLVKLGEAIVVATAVHTEIMKRDLQ